MFRFKCIWHPSINPEGKGVQDLAWLHSATPDEVRALPDGAGLKPHKHVNREVTLDHQDLAVSHSGDQPGHGACVDAKPCGMTAGRCTAQVHP